MASLPNENSLLSYDKDEMIPGLCTALLTFSLWLRKTRKHQLEDRLVKAVLPIIATNGVPHLQMKSVGSQNLSEREKKEIKERSL